MIATISDPMWSSSTTSGNGGYSGNNITHYYFDDYRCIDESKSESLLIILCGYHLRELKILNSCRRRYQFKKKVKILSPLNKVRKNIVLRSMFSKSGYLPKGGRKRFKDKG